MGLRFANTLFAQPDAAPFEEPNQDPFQPVRNVPQQPFVATPPTLSRPVTPQQPTRSIPPAAPRPSLDSNATGTSSVDALRAQIAEQFPLGVANLGDQATQDAAADLFNQLIRSAGGSPNLRNEIGDARFINRLQEFIGKGTTLDQSGIINIGNGVTIESLRDLADFNQPFVRGPGGHDDQAILQGPRFDNGGQARRGGGRGRGRGGGGGFGGGGGRGPNPGFLGFLENQLRDLFTGGFGIDQGAADAQRAALTSQSFRNQQAAFQGLGAQLNAAGGLGGGRHAALGEQLAQGFNESLLNQLAQFDLGLNQQSLQDRQATFGQGNQFADTLVRQQLGLGDIGVRRAGLGVQRELGLGDLALRRDLGFGDLGLRRELGLGNLGVAQGQLGLAQNNQLFNQGLQTFLTNSGLLGL